MSNTRRPYEARRARGFTLIELLVAVGIIVVLISILIPTLATVRSAARRTQTQTIGTQVVNAAQSFQADKRRMPGYFPPEAMGTNLNALTYGFTESENVLLDLVGGIITDASVTENVSNPQEELRFLVGPGPGDSRTDPNGLQVLVSNNRAISGVGAGYLRLDERTLRAVDGQRPGSAAIATTTNYVDIIDSFGMPMVVWTENAFANRTSGNYRFGQVSTNAGEGSFYWASNAGYFFSRGLGAGTALTAQTSTAAGDIRASILGVEGGGTNPNDSEIQLSLTGILGSPTLAKATELGVNDGRGPYATPEAARGRIIVHSAGPDRVYFSRRQDPTKNNTVGYLRLEGTPRRPVANSGEVDRFDDILTSGN